MVQRIKTRRKKQLVSATTDVSARLITVILDYFDGRVPLKDVLATGEWLQKQTEALPERKRQAIADQLQHLQTHQSDDPEDMIASAIVEDRLCNVLDLLTVLPPRKASRTA